MELFYFRNLQVKDLFSFSLLGWQIKDSFCARSVNCSFGASGEDKREEVFIIWEEKRRDPLTAIMLQEVECWPHL